jgi:tetratricopeptide (TPR) repeat protein
MSGGSVVETIDETAAKRGRGGSADTYSQLSGLARDVVQARDVHGAVNFVQLGQSPLPAPRQLPRDVRGFVGRSGEIAWLDRMLSTAAATGTVGISVISGTAGVGKSALAVHWAHRVRDQFADGQLYVDLRGHAADAPERAERVLGRFLRALGIPDTSVPPDLEEKAALYRSFLAERRILVVLDNAADSGQVRPLLPGSGSSAVVITSRNLLSGLMGRDGAVQLTLQVLPESDAIEVLRVIMGATRTGDEPELVSELATACAQLPLALRVAGQRAAARPLTPLDELLGALRDASARWAVLSADGEQNAETVRSIFDWSYRALPPDAARLFRFLGLHPGADISVDAAAALMAVSPSRVRILLDTLTVAHLLDQPSAGRFRMHDLLRAYAVDRAVHEGSIDERRAALHRVLTWYLHAADGAGEHLERYCFRPVPLEPIDARLRVPQFSSPGQAAKWYDAEWENLVAATRSAAAEGFDSIAWKLAVVFRFFYSMRADRFDAGITTEYAALDAARRLGNLYAEAEILDGLAIVYFQSGRLEESGDCYESALAIRRMIGDELGEAITLTNHALIFSTRRQWRHAIDLTTQSVALFEAHGDRKRVAAALGNLAEFYFELGRLHEALDLVCRAIALQREFDRDYGLADNLWNHSRILRALGQPEEALPTIEEALAAAERGDNDAHQAVILIERAAVLQANRRYDEAMTTYQEAVALHRRLGDRSHEAEALAGVATLYRERGNPSAAVAFHERAIAIQRAIDDRWNLAHGLASFADTFDQLRQTDMAENLRREAVELLSSFNESAAAASAPVSSPGD